MYHNQIIITTKKPYFSLFVTICNVVLLFSISAILFSVERLFSENVQLPIENREREGFFRSEFQKLSKFL